MKNEKLNKVVGYTMTAISFAFLAMILVSPAKAQENKLIEKQINACKAITAIFIENGKMNAGDIEYLSENLTIDEQKLKAKKYVKENDKAEIDNVKGECTLKISYKL